MLIIGVIPNWSILRKLWWLHLIHQENETNAIVNWEKEEKLHVCSQVELGFIKEKKMGQEVYLV